MARLVCVVLSHCLKHRVQNRLLLACKQMYSRSADGSTVKDVIGDINSVAACSGPCVAVQSCVVSCV